jgi:hypothetical protein
VATFNAFLKIRFQTTVSPTNKLTQLFALTKIIFQIIEPSLRNVIMQ